MIIFLPCIIVLTPFVFAELLVWWLIQQQTQRVVFIRHNPRKFIEGAIEKVPISPSYFTTIEVETRWPDVIVTLVNPKGDMTHTALTADRRSLTMRLMDYLVPFGRSSPSAKFTLIRPMEGRWTVKIKNPARMHSYGRLKRYRLAVQTASKAKLTAEVVEARRTGKELRVVVSAALHDGSGRITEGVEIVVQFPGGINKPITTHPLTLQADGTFGAVLGPLPLFSGVLSFVATQGFLRREVSIHRDTFDDQLDKEYEELWQKMVDDNLCRWEDKTP